MPRLFITVYPSGTKAWHVLYYVNGKPRTKKRGEFPAMTIKAARDAARKFEEDPHGTLAKTTVGTFGLIAEQFLDRHVRKNGLRSASDIERSLGYVLRRWRDRPFLEIRRRDVANLLDEIEDKYSAGVADGCLAVVRKLFNWYAARSDDYTSPIVAGMSRATSQPRERILTDDEIRAVWAACDGIPIFGDFVRVLLLTASRRAKVAEMRWEDIDEGGTWTISTSVREKGNAGQLVLPEMALTIIRRQPRLYGCPYVFPGRGGGPIAGFNKRMAALRAKLPGDMPQWQLHDLRRTARSLLSRAGVRPEISERVLGHALAGVEGVYNRHHYGEEKAEALNRLAALVATILVPPIGNVIPLKANAKLAHPTAAG